MNIVGAGKVGQTLAHLLQKTGLIQVSGVYNQSEANACRAIEFIGAGMPVAKLTDLPPADIVLITTPDSHIQMTCEVLAKHQVFKAGSTVFHCSGALSSDILHAAQAQGCYTASVHPMRSFADPQISVDKYVGTYCVMEGEAQALEILNKLFQKIGSIVLPIDKTKKSLYHAAAVFASNYLVTLAQAAEWCFTEAGIPASATRQMTSTLMHSTLSNLATMRPSDALTGPLKRGDISTIQSHVQALTDERLQSLYAFLGQATLPWVGLAVDKKEILEKIFYNHCR